MYLSLMQLNPRSPSVQWDLKDVQRLHCTIMKAFPNVMDPEVKARVYYNVLYRLEYDRNAGWQVYVQSAIPPDWSNLPDDYLLLPAGVPNPRIKRVDNVYDSIKAGRRLRFRLKANPTKKVDTKTSPDGIKRNGRRVPLRSAEEQIHWLIRKADQCGFALQQVVIAASGSAQVVKSNKSNLTFQGVTYEGMLEVTDSKEFGNALRNGIGPGKAYGFGLLSVAPV